MLERIADLTWRHPKRVLAAVAAFLVVAGTFGYDVEHHLTAAGFTDPASESERATALLRKIPFFSRYAGPDGEISLALSSYRPLASREEMFRGVPEREGWTSAALMTNWRPYPYRTEGTTGTRYRVRTPAFPGERL